MYDGDASANIVAGGAVVADCRSCPDGKKIGYIGYGGTLTFPDLTASVAGNYVLTVEFVDGDTSGGRNAVVRVDGTDYNEYFPGNGDWNGVQTLRMTVRLVPGDNSIEFSNPNAYAPDIAAIIV